MVVVVPEDSYLSYAGEENTLVLPITSFVRKDGKLVVVNKMTKEAAKLYPHLVKQWGWLITNGIMTPTFVSGNVRFLGLPDRLHYAAKQDEYLVESSLRYLQEVALKNQGVIYYLYQFNNNYELHENLLDKLNNVVLFRKEE